MKKTTITRTLSALLFAATLSFATDKNDDGFVIKPEYLKQGGDANNMADIDWSKIPLERDMFSPDAAYHYDGNVKFSFKNNILRIIGTLSRTK